MLTQDKEKMGGKYTLDTCPTGLKLLKMLQTKPAKIGTRCMPKHTKQRLDAKTCTTHGKKHARTCMTINMKKQAQCMDNMQIHT